MPEEDILERIDALALDIVENRQKSLLVLYYPEGDGEIDVSDISRIDDELRSFVPPNNDIDILLHTDGGDPNAAYRIIQCIRGVANKVSIFVPFKAYSSGTLMCFGTDKILLATSAVLSPIDIYVRFENDENNRIELAAIDKYIEFVKHCKKMIEDAEMETNLEEALLVEMVRQIGATNIGSFFRKREWTKYYAEILLSDYMLKDRYDGI